MFHAPGGECREYLGRSRASRVPVGFDRSRALAASKVVALGLVDICPGASRHRFSSCRLAIAVIGPNSAEFYPKVPEIGLDAIGAGMLVLDLDDLFGAISTNCVLSLAKIGPDSANFKLDATSPIVGATSLKFGWSSIKVRARLTMLGLTSARFGVEGTSPGRC